MGLDGGAKDGNKKVAEYSNKSGVYSKDLANVLIGKEMPRTLNEEQIFKENLPGSYKGSVLRKDTSPSKLSENY
jgi:hypothetical protein